MHNLAILLPEKDLLRMGFIAAKAMESEAVFLWIGLLTIIIIGNKVIFVKF